MFGLRRALCESPSGYFHRERAAQVWDLVTGQLKDTLPSNNYSITSVAISSDGRTIVSDGGDIKVWDLPSQVIMDTLAQ